MKPIRLKALEPQLLKCVSFYRSRFVERVEEADGIMFVCPKCLEANGGDRRGVHSIICWEPNVPLTRSPGPGRWSLVGTSLDDLSLVAGSSSIWLTSGCCWHGYVQRGEVRDA